LLPTEPPPPLMHWPLALQLSPVVQVPQLPLQPSEPHCFPLHWGVQPATHWPLALHESPWVQVPQEPPQLSEPHCLPLHCGVHAPSQAPLVHVCPSPQDWHAAPLVPQAPTLVPVWHAPVVSTQPLQVPPLEQVPLLHVWAPLHTAQEPPWAPHADAVFAGEMQVPLGAQHPLAHVAAEHSPPPPHTPSALHVWELPHATHAAPLTPQAESAPGPTPD
jgi:hypothetical protein